MFRCATTALPDAVSADGVKFDFGASSMQSVASRPADERTAPAWAAVERMLRQDEEHGASVLHDALGGDVLLDGWAEQIRPLGVLRRQ